MTIGFVVQDICGDTFTMALKFGWARDGTRIALTTADVVVPPTWAYLVLLD